MTAPIARIPDGTVNPNGDPIACTMFLLCMNEATLLIPHPVLDYVPSCERCATRLGYDSTDAPVAEIEFVEAERGS